jgi:hypothetical protein
VRLVPALPALMRAVNGRLADMPEAGRENFILGLHDGIGARGFADRCGPTIATASEGKVKSLSDLAVRFQDYMQWGSEDDALREWLANPIRCFVAGFGEDRTPALADLRRVMRAWHPGA